MKFAECGTCQWTRYGAGEENEKAVGYGGGRWRMDVFCDPIGGTGREAPGAVNALLLSFRFVLNT